MNHRERLERYLGQSDIELRVEDLKGALIIPGMTLVMAVASLVYLAITA